MSEKEIYGANPNLLYPCEKYDHICFIRNAVTHPGIVIGDYTYYSDLVHSPADFEKNNVLYLDELCQDKLIIGKYCTIASGAKFLMNAGNHKMAAFTGYPFKIFNANGWGSGERCVEDIHYKGNTIVGNDVWIGYESLVLPGSRIGDGAIIGARAVVSGTVPPYAIVAGNRATVIRNRFDDETIALLLKLKWWDWPPKKVVDHLDILTNCNVDTLRSLSNTVDERDK
ncbi:MAG: CatB-related O-acetyltransferase [Deltaproteobacteria bacterium]|nr:CatB-related O-acetyltransferase [Deltaproteobacteria bacterium]